MVKFVIQESHDRRRYYIFSWSSHPRAVPKLHGICMALREPKPMTIRCPVVGSWGVVVINWDRGREIATN